MDAGRRQGKSEERLGEMKKRRYALFFVVGLLLTFFVTAQRVEATLGESVKTVESDRKALSGVRGATSAGEGYTVQEFESNATTVREYVSPDGIVFGLAWKGLVEPDLTQLLGNYAEEYQQAVREAPHRRGSRRSRVKTDQIVVEKWGHMRSLQGRAYVPDLIPSGVSVNEIR